MHTLPLTNSAWNQPIPEQENQQMSERETNNSLSSKSSQFLSFSKLRDQNPPITTQKISLEKPRP